jgi:hypothetical protein
VQDRQSLSINSSDTSLSKSTQLDSAIPASKIAALSSGEFVGMVADNPDQKISLKMFHAEIINDHAAIKAEEDGYKPLPKIREVTEDNIRENYKKIKADIMELITEEFARRSPVIGESEQKSQENVNSTEESLPAKAPKGKPAFPKKIVREKKSLSL